MAASPLFGRVHMGHLIGGAWATRAWVRRRPAPAMSLTVMFSGYLPLVDIFGFVCLGILGASRGVIWYGLSELGQAAQSAADFEPHRLCVVQRSMPYGASRDVYAL